MSATIYLRNDKFYIIEGLTKILASNDPSKVVEKFDDFVFYNGTFYNFIGDSTFVVRGDDIHCVLFSK